MNKIINSFYIQAVSVLFFLLIPAKTNAQDTVLNHHGLWVISAVNDYQLSTRGNPQKEMVDLSTIPGIVFDLRYAGNDNFVKATLYPPLKTSFLRKPVAAALTAIQQELKKQGLGIKVFDAYRPYSITEKMWQLVKDDRYAANPKTGSGHNRGVSVDLTLIDLRTKAPLNMGTDFDNFTDTAHHDFTALPQPVLQNRSILLAVMEKNGFKALATEWWHYTFITLQPFELLDVKFDELGKKHQE